ncbi:MAG TPA: hypothetical protein VEL76_19285 [Gemmataceae bacterium]|nr:hypothetical protein [Gemmataceae bacterium]
MYRLAVLLIVPLLLLAPLASTAGDKKKPDETKKPPDDKKKPPEEKKKPPPPKLIIAKVELQDGTSVQCLFPPKQTVTIRGKDVPPITLKIEEVRYLDLETDVHRVGTQTLDTFYGEIQTAEFNVRMLVAQQDVALPRARIKRIFFPEMPRVLTVPY